MAMAEGRMCQAGRQTLRISAATHSHAGMHAHVHTLVLLLLLQTAADSWQAPYADKLSLMTSYCTAFKGAPEVRARGEGGGAAARAVGASGAAQLIIHGWMDLACAASWASCWPGAPR